LDPVLEQPRAAFVTLKKNGRLRGCIGSMRPDRPLYRTVGQLALQAAFNDRRFPELKADELVSLEIEISVLTPFEKIQDPDLIQTGRDGVMLKKEGRSAVFLPQVALEQGWSCRQMLAQLCLKAGLPENSWQHGADLYAFRALVFKESDFD
jgi:AmmeMemoRadiSam system protein A